MKKKIGVSDMDNVSGGFKINYHGGSNVQLQNISDEERDRLIAYCETHANEISEPYAMAEVGSNLKAPTFGDWANSLRERHAHAPVMPITLAAEIFHENERLQKLANLQSKK